MDYREGYLELLAERSTLKGKNKALLAALEEIEMIASKNAGPGLVDIRSIAWKAIKKATGTFWREGGE